jgi:hypothetical protein
MVIRRQFCASAIRLSRTLLCKIAVTLLAALPCLLLPLGPATAGKDTNPLTLHIKANDLAYSKLTGLVLASVSADATKYANTLTLIDPRTGVVVHSLYIGNEPFKLAISDKGEVAYVAYDRLSIKRVDLASLTVDQSFSIPAHLAGEPFSIADIKVMPNHPNTVAVAVRGSTAIAIFDDGVKRPVSVPSDFVAGVRAFQLAEDGTTAYGLDPSTFEHSLVTMSIASEGVHVRSRADGIATGLQLRCESATCFTESGSVLDASSQSALKPFLFDRTNFMTEVDQSRVAPDVLNGVVYFLGWSFYYQSLVVSSYDLKTRILIRSLRLPRSLSDGGGVGDFFIWGGDQLAFNTPTNVVLLPTTLLSR